MEIQEAYEILELDVNATETDLNDSYKRLIKIHHPDKNSDSDFSYKLNEAKQLLIEYLNNKSSREVALYVSHALMNIRKTDKKEIEIRNEIELLITTGIKSKKNRIERYRNYSIVGTFIIAVLSFISYSSNGFFDSYFNSRSQNEIMIEVANKMYKPTLDSLNSIKQSTVYKLDSLYIYDEKFRNNVKTREEIYKTRDTKSAMIKTMLGSYAALLILAVAFFQMRVKQYDSDLEQLKKIIDIKFILKRLLLTIVESYKLDQNSIEESHLIDSIVLTFNNEKHRYKELQLNKCIELGRKLSITDLGRILLLKLLEKDLITEIDQPNSKMKGVWYKLKI